MVGRFFVGLLVVFGLGLPAMIYRTGKRRDFSVHAEENRQLLFLFGAPLLLAPLPAPPRPSVFMSTSAPFVLTRLFFCAKLTYTLVFRYDSNAETLLLTGSYKSQFLWWEAVILLRKLSLKCVVVFINSPITQGCGCLLFSFVPCCAVLCSAQCLNKNACQIFTLGSTTALQPWRAG